MIFCGTKVCGHDSAVCVLDTERRTIFAMSTERVSRIKHDTHHVGLILKAYPEISEISVVSHCYSDFKNKSHDNEATARMVFTKLAEEQYRKLLKPRYIKDLRQSKKAVNSILLKALFFSPKVFFKYQFFKLCRAIFFFDVYFVNAFFFKRFVKEIFKNRFRSEHESIEFYDHHLSHAYASFVVGYRHGDCAPIFVTLDGQGDGFFSKGFVLSDDKKNLKLVAESEARFYRKGIYFSIGHIYSNFTETLGYTRASDEGKVEALAAFGSAPAGELAKMLSLTKIDDKGIKFLDSISEYYDRRYLADLLKKHGRENFSALVQAYLERVVLDFLRKLKSTHGSRELYLSGGVAANIILSLRVYESNLFDRIFILPPMGDEGLALGSAALAMNARGIFPPDVFPNLEMPYWGDALGREDTEAALRDFGEQIRITPMFGSWTRDAAEEVARGGVCGFFNGKMEFGPRALGNRSIIADPRFSDMRERINQTIKRRPIFQPFCPSILELERERLFESSYHHKHMATAFLMKREFHSALPCAVHVDGTARPQFVTADDNPDYHSFLLELKRITGYGVCINTSFNMHGRTIVRTVEDAVRDMLDCNLDFLYVNGFKVEKRS